MAHISLPTSREEIESFGEMGYYQDSLRGAHQSLTFMGKRPLFILKDEWETSPPAGSNSYHQVLDPRTQLFMDMIEKESVEIQPVALVQWKVPNAGPGLNFLKPEEGKKKPEPEYMIKLAMMNADAMGVGGEDEDELDVVSSDDEEGLQLRKGKGTEKNDDLTVYYPLIPMPSRDRGKAIRQTLRSLVDDGCGATGRFAKEWLDEIERVDKFPTVLTEE
ncbi:unnamed protein product [Rhizoctonia solani]|uniref:Uncharacterized protein n=1 Tax=Rhizoctonia solani TaxID=456999 RepID=A0A8H3DRJ5_9AGAM|nr:unnamed protein product [Rhizoctonia solani]